MAFSGKRRIRTGDRERIISRMKRKESRQRTDYSGKGKDRTQRTAYS
jgi:hypothetical protein